MNETLPTQVNVVHLSLKKKKEHCMLRLDSFSPSPYLFLFNCFNYFLKKMKFSLNEVTEMIFKLD
jgi:hypothetical protein